MISHHFVDLDDLILKMYNKKYIYLNKSPYFGKIVSFKFLREKYGLSINQKKFSEQEFSDSHPSPD